MRPLLKLSGVIDRLIERVGKAMFRLLPVTPLIAANVKHNP